MDSAQAMRIAMEMGAGSGAMTESVLGSTGQTYHAQMMHQNSKEADMRLQVELANLQTDIAEAQRRAGIYMEMANSGRQDLNIIAAREAAREERAYATAMADRARQMQNAQLEAQQEAALWGTILQGAFTLGGAMLAGPPGAAAGGTLGGAARGGVGSAFQPAAGAGASYAPASPAFRPPSSSGSWV